jgi:cell division protein ZapE
MLSTPNSSFSEAYQAQIASGAIEPDAAQAEVAEAYAALDLRLANYSPKRKQGLLARLFSGDKDEAPRGLYIHGEVGRGKTMLMDLFFQHSNVEHKRRANSWPMCMSASTTIARALPADRFRMAMSSR